MATKAELEVRELAAQEKEHNLVKLNNELLLRQRKLDDLDYEITQRDAASKKLQEEAAQRIANADHRLAEAEKREIAVYGREQAVQRREQLLIDTANKIRE